MNSKFKLLLATVIDAIIFILSFSLIALFSNNVIVKNVTNYNELALQCNNILLDSGIYEERNSSIVLIEDNIDKKLIIFYQKYNSYYDSTHKTVSYEDAKAKSGLFNLNSKNEYVLKEDADENKVKAFFQDELYKASVTLANDKVYKQCKKKIDDINTIATYSYLFITSVLMLIVIPLINKNHATIGQMILKLKLYSDYNKVSKIQIFVRFLTFFSVELLASLTFYGITFIISLILMLFSKKNKFICDFIASTYVSEVDNK